MHMLYMWWSSVCSYFWKPQHIASWGLNTHYLQVLWKNAITH